MSLIMDFVQELIAFIAQLASGSLTIEDARKRAADLMQRKPEQLTDALLDELNAKMAALEAKE